MDLDRLRQSGNFSDDEIKSYQSEQTAKLQAANYSPQDINDYWGVKPASAQPTTDMIKANIAARDAKEASSSTPGAPPKQREAQSWEDAIAAGWQMSVSSLYAHGRPDVILPEHASLAQKILSGIPELVGDAPAIAAGMLAGGAVAGPVGGAAGAFAVPAGLRKALIDHIEKGDIQSKEDFVARLGASSWAALKGGVVGAVTGGAGRFAGPIAEGVAGATAGKIAATASEIAAMTTAGAAVEGKLPEVSDFAAAALTVGGIHAIGAVLPGGKSPQTKIQEIYKATGETPHEVAIAAATDPVLKQQLVLDHEEIPQVNEANAKLEREMGLEPKADSGAGEPPSDPPPGQTGGDGGSRDGNGLSDDEKQILSRIGEDVDRPEETLRDKIRQARIDNLDANEELKNVGAEKTYQTARRYNAVADRVQSFLEDGTRNQAGEKTGEGLIPILKENETTNVDPGNRGLLAFMMAKRGLELDARGVESLFDSDQTYQSAKKVVEAGAEKYGPVFERIKAFENRVLDYWGESGMSTPERLQGMKDLNQDHLPLNTIQEIDELTGQKGGGSRGLIHAIRGSLDLKRDPIESMFRNTEALIKRADVNNIRRSLVNEMGPELGSVLREVEPKMTALTVDEQELGSKLGIDPDLLEHGFDVWRREAAKGNENTVDIWIDGKKRVFEGTPEIIDTLQRLDGDQTAVGTWGKLMRGFAYSLRIGSVDNPAFAFKHFFRSQYSAGLYSKTGMIPFIHPLMSLPDFFTKPETYRNWLYDGGAVSSIDKIDSDFLSTNVYKAKVDESGNYSFTTPSFWNKTWNTLKRTPHAFTDFISITDNLARYTEYKRGVEQGADRADAAFDGRNVTADYQRRGAKNSALRSATAFMNVHLQVTDRVYQEMTSQQKLGYAAKVFAGITMPSLLLWAATKDDSRVKELPYYQKIMSFNIPVDHWRDMAPGEDESVVPDDLKRQSGGKTQINDGPVLHLPVPGEPGIAFGTGVAQCLSSFAKKDPEACAEAAKHLLGSTLVMPVPTMLTAPLEHYANKNLFTQNKIVSNTKLKELPQDQYDPYTSETAKQVAKGIGYIPFIREIGPGNMTLQSPMVIDNYIQAWTGGGGRFATNIADMAFHKAGIGQDRVEPEKDFTEYPGLKSFFTQFPNSRPQSLDEFDRKYEHMQQVQSSMKDAAKRGDQERVAQIQSAYGSELVRLNGIQKSIQTAGKLLQTVKADTENYSPKDKKQIMTTVYYQMLQLSRAGNQAMDQADKALKEGN